MKRKTNKDENINGFLFAKKVKSNLHYPERAMRVFPTLEQFKAAIARVGEYRRSLSLARKNPSDIELPVVEADPVEEARIAASIEGE